jgi:hypothetical protein
MKKLRLKSADLAVSALNLGNLLRCINEWLMFLWSNSLMNLILLASLFVAGLSLIRLSVALSKQQRRVLVRIKR